MTVSEHRLNELRALAAKVCPMAETVQAARKRTGDDTLGLQVEAGKTRVVRTTYSSRNGVATVESVTGWMNHDAALAYVEAM